jgi:hypothetical protein
VEKLSGLDAASGERPVVFERFASSFDEQDSAFLEDERSYSEDGPGRISA